MKKTIVAVLACLLVLVDPLPGLIASSSAQAAEPPGITLNGTIDAGEAGYIDAKTITASAGQEVRVNYRLRPNYATGAASGVRVEVFLPSLEYVDGEYQMVNRGHSPTPMGLQGRVASDDTWSVIGNTTAQGGSVIMEYNGDLGGGTNPAFDLWLTTYNDGTDGPYGGVPEGTAFEINGFVSYESFNREDGTSWSTPQALDDESRVSVIASDLTWEASIEPYLPHGGTDVVPIWDRYQFVDYLYTLTNTSDNIASDINGYTLSLDIDSTATSPNGIIPQDITRWIYQEDGDPIRNYDVENTTHQYVGVPGEGGVLIYDITEWDGVSPLTDELPYSYSGTGSIMVDRQHGANRDPLTPEEAPGLTERQFLISLPLSRQGFPTIPTNFRVLAISNVLFAGSANWSKSTENTRELQEPTYEFSFTHTPGRDSVVYGYEVFTEISQIRNDSNAPVFEAALDYRVDDDFAPQFITYEVPQARIQEFQDTVVRYSYTDPESGDEVDAEVAASSIEPDIDLETVLLTFDVSEVADLEWGHSFTLGLTERLDPAEALPVVIRVYGQPYRVGDMSAEATVKYLERFASNEDYNSETTYTDVDHEVTEEAVFDVIFPDAVVPSVEVRVDGFIPDDEDDDEDNQAVPYDTISQIDLLFGVNDTMAENSTTTLTLNEDVERLSEATLTLREALFEQAVNVRVSYELLDGAVHQVDLSDYDGVGDLRIELPASVSTIIIDTDEFTSDGVVNFASVEARVGSGAELAHTIDADIRTYQPAPYDLNSVDNASVTIDIVLPEVDAIGVYGSVRSQATTNVSYESTFDVEYQLDTHGVSSRPTEYVIDMLTPSGEGALAFRGISLQSVLLDAVTDVRVTLFDSAGNEQAFTADDLTESGEIDTTEITLSDVAKIVISGEHFMADGAQTMAIVTYDADIELGSSQPVQATFAEAGAGVGAGVVLDTATNRITVQDTQTQVTVQGVNQVSQELGTGSVYAPGAVPRELQCGVGNRITDNTLDQGYKSLGGFTASFTRPTVAYLNNNQRTSIEVDLPHDHFDLFYVKIRDDLQPYIDSVDVYRTEDGQEELWTSVDGGEWVENSQEGSGYWRIGTARPSISDERIFDTYDSVVGVEDHPYYKDAWDQDSQPAAPVSRVIVNLTFEREDNDALPQLAGQNANVIEYMGRFYSTSINGAQQTVLGSTDVIGDREELTRTDGRSVNSLVHYPYADTSTGAHDNTSLANKVIVMGETGEYLASIRNLTTRSWSVTCAAHGPDIYVPERTNHNEWLRVRNPQSFHDELVYEFVYPASPAVDSVYHYDPSHVVITDTSTLQYLTGVRVFGANGDELTFHLAQPLTEAVRFEYDNDQPRGIHAADDGTFVISFGEAGIYPATFEAIFEQVPGFGERTAEIDGVNADQLGSSLAEVDVRIGGIVNGNRALRGTTNLYRVPEDTGSRELLHTTSATLTGYTPRLGARVEMSFDDLKVYDYGVDGITPNTTQITAGIENTSEADITDVELALTLDTTFRTRLIEIPEDIFNGDWTASSVTVTQGASSINIPVERFTLNAETGNYELDLIPLFEDGTLATTDINVTLGGDATLLRRHIDTITVTFTPSSDDIRMWGSVSRGSSEDELSARMLDGGNVFVTGVWVDEDAEAYVSGPNWNSIPSFVTQTTKGSNEQLRRNTDFTVRAEVQTDSPIYTSAGSGNAGQRPSLRLTGSGTWQAPRLYSRVARLQTSAAHLQNDYSRTDNTHLFYDSDTDAQIHYQNIVVGDTVKVLYELRNIGQDAAGDREPGSLPVHRPIAHVTTPGGLDISEIQVLSADLAAHENLTAVIEDRTSNVVDVSADQVAVDQPNAKRADVTFDLTLQSGESVFFVVEYIATNDFGPDADAAQNRQMQWNVYARPDYAHHYMSYDSVGDGSADARISGTTATINYDGDNVTEHLGRVYNTNYRFANPNQLVIVSAFDTENISGETMQLTVRNIRNEIAHDNTSLDVFVVFDRGAQGSFELTDFPQPTYPDELPAGFSPEFSQPRVYFKDAEGDWVAAEDFVEGEHVLADINELWVEYGLVPAVNSAVTGEPVFELPEFSISGIGHWRSAGSQTTKYYDLPSHAQIRLTHHDDTGASEYGYTPTATQRIWKALPQVEFNLQSFDTLAGAQADYDGSDLGKTSYLPGDDIHIKITAQNHTTHQGTNTNTAYGKAPLLRPVIFDKIPEYLTTALLDYADDDGVLDVAGAVAAGVLEIRVIDADGELRAAQLPTATVETVQGYDIGGAQTFANDRHNDAWGLLSSAEPINTSVNPAETIDFQVVTYVFEGEDLGRGERIEVIYSAQAREDDLPIARYPDGRAVFAPLFGWYGNNTPVANSASETSMDMAALLHDAGLSGTRSHETTETEFLSNSYSWHPGTTATDRRRQAGSHAGTSWQTTYYDASANTQRSHTAYLREDGTNNLYAGFSSGVIDDNFNLATRDRVEDSAVTTDATTGERILWAQDGLQLSRAWLYGASEMVPDIERASWGVDGANFYEYDGSLNSDARHRLGYSPYVEDDYSYAVQLHEEFTVRLHGVNMGDRSIHSGLEYTEILPIGISPYDSDGDLLGVTVFNGHGDELPIESYDVEVIQTPGSDAGYRAPAQSQEADTYGPATREEVPYVVRVRVTDELTSMFNNPGAHVNDKYQRVDIRVRVHEELPPSENGISYWHDQLTITTISEEPYLEVYTSEYGAFHQAPTNLNRQGYPNDAMEAGIDANGLAWRHTSARSTFFSVEPWGVYIRGLNAQGTATTADGKPAIVTGDQIAMRKPTLRVWTAPDNDYFTVDLYEQFTLNSTVENQQLEVLGAYNRAPSGYTGNQHADVWTNAPQTIGGARGSWFEPEVTIELPYGIAPVLEDGSSGRYYNPLAEQQQVSFTASLNDVDFATSTVVSDVTNAFDVEVELSDDEHGKPRFLLHFTANSNEFFEVAYGQSLVISPRVETIDAPEGTVYEGVQTFAKSQRPVFNPIVSEQYTTGSVPAMGGRNSTNSFNGRTITVNDRTRLDSTSIWSGNGYSNRGVLDITERLIDATQPYEDGAFGSTTINLSQPSITNSTRAALYADSTEQELLVVDAAGKYWYSTNVDNSLDPNPNPYEEFKTTGDVHNSRFVVTHHATSFAETTGEVRIKLDGTLYNRAEFEDLGYTVELLSPPARIAGDGQRSRVQWLVTTPANDFGTRGMLRSGENFTLLTEMLLVDGYVDNVVVEDETWRGDELIVDSYISLITDDVSLIPANVSGAQDLRDFITQSTSLMNYHEFVSDQSAGLDIDGNGDTEGLYAWNTAEIEILKPSAEVRVNTLRPRIAYSNGMSGDTYFNAAETIDYVVTHAAITGSGLKEFVVESILPTHESNDPSVSVSNEPVTTNTRYVTTGKWHVPQPALNRLEETGTELDDAFRTFVYASHELAEEGYEGGDWTLLNPGGTSIETNERIDLADIAGFDVANVKKIRVVVRALNPDAHLVPRGLSLDIDADPETPERESVLDTDPDNHSIEAYPESVTGAAVMIGVQVASEARSTLFIYDTVQVWGNYISDRFSHLAQSETRSYLTPSRPVVNVEYEALYYRFERDDDNADLNFRWSENVAIAPDVSPHLKFSGTFTNADDSMWSRDEDSTYAADLLMNPFVTFELPAVLSATGTPQYVTAGEIDGQHPLSSDYRSRYSLTNNETNLWTWRIESADGGAPSPESWLTHTDVHLGSWPRGDRNLLSVWFEGSIDPGDRVVVEFIGAVEAYAPGTDAEDLRSRAMISNSTGLLFPLNSQQNSSNRLGYTTDVSDYNSNVQTTDRLVFAERGLFQYATFDNFGKRKISRSDLNRAGTVSPDLTPVRQGGDFEFEISLDNARPAGGAPYPYPIMYDVLPFSDDTEIMRPSVDRNSQYSAWLNPEGMSLARTGDQAKVYDAHEYTVYVGPFSLVDGEIVEAEMVPEGVAGTEAFYDALGVPGQASATRDAHFVALDEFASEPELLRSAKTILVLFNDPAEGLPGQSQLTFTYGMKSPLNAPVHLEQFDDEQRRGDTELWNSFVATQRSSGFAPQESNLAGAYATEHDDLVYIGNYVWNDVNYNGLQDEGTTFIDDNGRTLLRPSRDLDYDGQIDDPGINGVQVTLLTAAGYHVDEYGNPIHLVGDEWQIVDEATGESVLDEVFEQPIVSEGPMITETETDFYGHDGYYTFSNIAPGDYRVLLEFPAEYDRYSVTTDEVFAGTAVEAYLPGDELGVPAGADDERLVIVTEPAAVTTDTTDDERMSFDIGIGHKITLGGTIFEDAQLDGRQSPTEPGLAGYHVYLKHMNGDTVLDEYGDPMRAVTDADGHYEFDLLPIERDYYIEVTDQNDEFSTDWIVSPIVHNADPFAEVGDNDGYTERDSTVVKTNTLHFDIESLIRSDFEDRLSVSVGFYERSETSVIGNRVWHDLNRDGLQDPGEPGIAGQELFLEQYTLVDGVWVLRDGFSMSATSNADGYYYFEDVPSIVRDAGGDIIETRYQVVVEQLVTGYTFTTPNSSAPAGTEADEVDSDFYGNGTLHPTSVVGTHLIDLAETDPVTGVTFGLDDNTIDLGLVPHALSSLSGEIFIDANRDGLNNDSDDAGEIYTAALEVRHAGEWVPARQGDDGVMIEPANADTSDPPIVLTGVSAYEFTDLHIIDSIELTAYEYRVVVTQMPRWQDVTELQVGNDPAIDNDFEFVSRGIYGSAASDSRLLGDLTSDGYLHPIETFAGTPATHVDLGLVNRSTQASIGDVIWDDRNGNGIQDADEPGIPGRTVVLNRVIDGDLVPVTDTVTDGDGRYEFAVDVADFDPDSATYNEPYTYVVEINLDSTQTISPAYEGTDTARDSDFAMLMVGGSPQYGHAVADPAHTAISGEFTLVEADAEGLALYETTSSTDTIDAGVVTHEVTRVIGDTLFDDLNRDGVQSAGEPGIADLVVRIFQLNQSTGLFEPYEPVEGDSVVVTGADGAYEFVVEIADLDKASEHYRVPHEYRVLAEAPAHMRLVEIDNVFAYASADVDGIAIAKPYSFVLSDIVQVVSLDDEGNLSLADALDVRSVDAGFAIYDTEVTIGGRVWEDADADGLQGDDEVGIADRTVLLWEFVDDEWLAVEDLLGRGEVVTGADGEYEFLVSPTHYDEDDSRFLNQRQYRVTLDRAGYEAWSPLNVGDDSAIDSDVLDGAEFGSPMTGMTHPFVIADVVEGRVDVGSVRDDISMDVGITTYPDFVTIGGRVWEDADADGLQGEDEVGIADRTVVLWEFVDDEWVAVEDLLGRTEMVTGVDGEYEFLVSPTHYDVDHARYLAPREYRVTVERAGYEAWSPLTVGEDPAIDSDVTSAPEFGGLHTGVTRTFNISVSNEGVVDIAQTFDDIQMDIGLKTYEDRVWLGGHLWSDDNEDGERQPGEAWLEGQTVTLWESVDGEWQVVDDLRGMSVQETDARGTYQFEVEPIIYDVDSERYLEPREYRVSMETPEGYVLSEGSITAFIDGDSLVSINALLTVVDDSGNADISAVSSDHTLDFPLTPVPEVVPDPDVTPTPDPGPEAEDLDDPELPATGVRFNFMDGVAVLLMGIVLMLIAAMVRRSLGRAV